MVMFELMFVISDFFFEIEWEMKWQGSTFYISKSALVTSFFFFSVFNYKLFNYFVRLMANES